MTLALRDQQAASLQQLNNSLTRQERRAISEEYRQLWPSSRLAVRLLLRIRPDSHGCWNWDGAATNRYGRIRVNPMLIQITHRLAYELFVGVIPHGMFALHRCDNPPCLRPEHLFLGDAAANVADRDAKGRQARGSRTHTAKLTTEDVLAIRRLYEPRQGTYRVLAELFGVSERTVRDVVNRVTWRHLPTADREVRNEYEN
jgi:hypothetical protein